MEINLHFCDLIEFNVDEDLFRLKEVEFYQINSVNFTPQDISDFLMGFDSDYDAQPAYVLVHCVDNGEKLFRKVRKDYTTSDMDYSSWNIRLQKMDR